MIRYLTRDPAIAAAVAASLTVPAGWPDANMALLLAVAAVTLADQAGRGLAARVQALST
jgi:hypothetical protein